MSDKGKILIVEDEHRIARFLQMELQHEGFEAATEDNGRRAYDRIMQEDYDLILLDVMLPEMDGLTICQRVRELSDVPIIMLTARDEIDDKVKGLNIGADDYMTKPFATPELLARINVALRKRTRSEVREQSEGEVLRVKNLAMYTLRHEVMVGEESVELTKKEYDLLEMLLRNKRNVLTRDQILSDVWGYDYMGDSATVTVHINRIREKIEQDPKTPRVIETVWGAGYKLNK